MGSRVPLPSALSQPRPADLGWAHPRLSGLWLVQGAVCPDGRGGELCSACLSVIL